MAKSNDGITAVTRESADLSQPNQDALPPISSIRAKKLFGKYNLSEIKVKDVLNAKPSITFLYGENGIGKTTILRLIFSILAPAPNEGHRTLIGNTKFEEFMISFHDGQVVSVIRPRGECIGDFSYIFSGPRINAEVNLSESELGFTDWPNEKRDKIKRLSDMISRISPRIIFVNDHRTIRSTHPPWDLRTAVFERPSVRHTSDGDIEYVEADTPDVGTLVSAELDSLLEATWRHFADSAFSGNRRASVGTGQIYLDIAKAAVARSGALVEQARIAADKEFRSRCDAVISYLQTYGRYRIIEADTVPELLATVEELDLERRSQVLFILEPYLTSIERRISETQPLSKQILAFERSINFFLFKKRATIKINERMNIKTDDNEPLKTRDLSSGERHLLYLCCSAVLSWESPTLMLYDEPELSLNPKWQRKLVDTLLEIASPTTQFIMATHSFEIISRHRDYASRIRIVK